MTTKFVDHGPLGDLVLNSANWASFLKKMYEDAMILEIMQEEKTKILNFRDVKQNVPTMRDSEPDLVGRCRFAALGSMQGLVHLGQQSVQGKRLFEQHGIPIENAMPVNQIVRVARHV
jgi:hypothetical protein